MKALRGKPDGIPGRVPFPKALRNALILGALVLRPGVGHGGPALADRLIVEVNKKSFSQRQVEIHTAVKAALQPTDDKGLRLPSREAWNDVVNEFVRDALVDQEALRLNTFRPTGRMIAAGEQLIAAKRARWPDLHHALLRLAADRGRVRDALAAVLRVRAFIRIKDKELQTDDIPIESGETVDPSSDWYMSLEKRVPFRVYEGGRSYQDIAPVGGKGA